MFKRDDHIEAILVKARVAADEAGDKWLAEHTQPRFAVYSADLAGRPTSGILGTMLDVCGGAYICFKDKRTKFARYMKEREREERRASGCDTRFFQFYSIHVHHKNSGRQEMGLAEAAIKAYYEVLRQHQLADCIYVKTFID